MSASVDDNVLQPRAWEYVHFTINVGGTPVPHRDQGKYVITLQVAPFARRDEAELVMRAVWSRCGLKFKTETEDAEDATGAKVIAIADRRRAPRPSFTYAQAVAGQGVKTGARTFGAIELLERQFRQLR